MSDSGFYFYRRNLPHYRDENATYFVTWRTAIDAPDLSPDERDVVFESCHFNNGKKYELDGFVVMNDHVHVILRPFAGEKLEKTLQAIKSFTAHKINKIRNTSGGVWQEESYDRIIRDQDEWEEKMNYIIENAQRRWPEIEVYKWLWHNGM